MGKIFYKYRTDSKYTEQLFTTGQVFLSTAEGLNDPFECSLQDIGREWIEQQVAQMKQSAAASFMLQVKRAQDNNGDFFGLKRDKINEILETIQQSKSIEDIYILRKKIITEQTGHPPTDVQRIFSRIDAQLLAVGIFSMSINPDHPLMWAHYAGDHSGICLGFEQTPDSHLSDSSHCMPVIYSDSLPEMSTEGFKSQMSFSLDRNARVYTSGFQIAFSDKTFQKAVTTKPTCWSYEEEWRYIEPYGGLFDWPGPLSEITFGLRCNEERRNYYIRLAEEHVPNEVKLFKMCKIHCTNTLKRCRYEIPITKPKQTAKPKNNLISETEHLKLQEFVTRMERLLQQAKYGEVIFQTDENLKKYPDSTILLHFKGVAHGYTQEHDKALECFRKLTEGCPSMAQAWYQMSCALIALNRHEEAIIALKRAFEIDPNDASISLNLGIELLRVQESPDEALVYLSRAENLGHRRAHQIIASIEGR